MEKEDWSKIQTFVEAGKIDLVIHLIEAEFKSELSEEQLLPLGNIRDFLISMFSEKQSFTVQQCVCHTIELLRQGYIIGVKEQK